MFRRQSLDFIGVSDSIIELKQGKMPLELIIAIQIGQKGPAADHIPRGCASVPLPMVCSTLSACTWPSTKA
jgi:hypothetical protein